jgi:hypothetical protein
VLFILLKVFGALSIDFRVSWFRDITFTGPGGWPWIFSE